LRWPGWGRIARWLAKLAAAFVVLSVAWVLLYAVLPPPGTPLMLIRALGGAGMDRQWVPLGAVAPDVFRAVIAAEDTSFCTHHGFDWESLWAAWKRDQSNSRRLRGGSTITQQAAKNLFLWPDRTLVRKGVEAWFTVLLELFLGKPRILLLYVNDVEWASGVYGIEAAARYHFRKPAASLTRQEAALLAAVLPSPRRWSPSHPTAFIQRRAAVIEERMRVAPGRPGDPCG
jgi:monofunctional biosynthetic peptidoglycan transglycosylase